jgi:imidazoleglycerol phosphate dehydratase HisB
MSAPHPAAVQALKLDIDTANEFEFMEHMLEDASIRAMVAEVFHELHYHNAQMNRFGWASFPLDYAEVADALRGLRMAGILLHYWP